MLRPARRIVKSFCGLSKVTRHITQRIWAHEALRESRDRLTKKAGERMAAEQTLRESETSLRMLSRTLFHIQDEERRHLGHELHDNIGQCLSALKMELDTLRFEPAIQEKEIRQQLEQSISLVDRCIKDVRTMSYLLYPPLLEEMGLKMAIPWYLDGFAKRSGIKTKLDISPDFGRLPRKIELVIFRILQECLTNGHRQSDSSMVLIRVFTDSDVAILEVEDAGEGVLASLLEFGPQGIHDLGIGLPGMTERVRGVRGKLELSLARTGRGTTVRAIVPCAEASSQENVH